MSELQHFSPEDLVALSTLISLALAKDRTPDEINVLGNWIVEIGCVLLTIAAQKQFLEDAKQPQSTVNDQIKELQQQVRELQQLAQTAPIG